jgi:predicted small secreted protein
MKTKTLFVFLFAAAVSFLSAGCNTMNGAGKDIEKAGEKIQDAAKK